MARLRTSWAMTMKRPPGAWRLLAVTLLAVGVLLGAGKPRPLTASDTLSSPLRGAVVLGPVPEARTLELDVMLRPRNTAELSWLATAVSTPGSPLRGHYLSSEGVDQLVSPTVASVRSVAGSLDRLGLDVTSVSADRLILHVRADAGTVEKALGVTLERVKAEGGQIGFANLGTPRLPASLGVAVEAVVGLDSFQRLSPAGLAMDRRPAARSPRAVTVAKSVGPQPCAAAASALQPGSYAAPELAQAYGLSELYEHDDFGTGTTVGLVELEPDQASDIRAFAECYGIKDHVHYYSIDGGVPASAYQSGEAALDIETLMSLAPGVTEDVYQTQQSLPDYFDLLDAISRNTTIKVVSMSWGSCELAFNPEELQAESLFLEAAAAEGQSWLVAAGDSGSTGCLNSAGTPIADLDVDDPAAQPFVTGVGGTRLPDDEPAAPESVWNDDGGAGGGGISDLWPMPAFQASAASKLSVINVESSGKPCGLAVGVCREVPDVSADADPQTGYLFYFAGDWYSQVGGTSAAAPLWASLLALTDAYPVCRGRAVGFANPSLYSIAAAPGRGPAIEQVAHGTNDDAASGYLGGLYAAKPGYNMAAGLGVPFGLGADNGGLAPRLCADTISSPVGLMFISPTSGRARGTQVSLYGYGLSHRTVRAVRFGRLDVAFKIVNASLIHVTSPAGRGSAKVSLETPTGWTPPTAEEVFTYAGT